MTVFSTCVARRHGDRAAASQLPGRAAPTKTLALERRVVGRLRPIAAFTPQIVWKRGGIDRRRARRCPGWPRAGRPGHCRNPGRRRLRSRQASCKFDDQGQSCQARHAAIRSRGALSGRRGAAPAIALAYTVLSQRHLTITALATETRSYIYWLVAAGLMLWFRRCDRVVA